MFLERVGASNKKTEVEAKLSGTYDAVLVHSYWLSREEPYSDEFRGSLRTRLATRAAVLLGENAGKIVFLGGKLKGPSYPSTAQLSREEAMGNYGVSSNRIIACPQGYGTAEEADIFKRLAKENRWRKVAVIGFKSHYRSIEKDLPEGDYAGINITHLPVEDIINAKDNDHVKQLVWRLTTLFGIKIEKKVRPKKAKKRINPYGVKVNIGRYEIAFKGYELAKDVFMRLPGAKRKIYAKNKVARGTKDDSILNDFVTSQIDVFKT